MRIASARTNISKYRRRRKAATPALRLVKLQNASADGRRRFGHLPARFFERRFHFALRQLIKREVDDGRGVERQHLRNDQAADDRDAEWCAKFAADAHADRERQRAEDWR